MINFDLDLEDNSEPLSTETPFTGSALNSPVPLCTPPLHPLSIPSSRGATRYSKGSSTVSLRSVPTYVSFPSPNDGRSPTYPEFRVPRYGYYGAENQDVRSSWTFDIPTHRVVDTTNQILIPTKLSTFGACVQSIVFFLGVSTLETNTSNSYDATVTFSDF